MRKILFRGQTRRYGEKVWMNGEKVPSNWVYGGVLQGTGDFSIIYGCNDVDDKKSVNLGKHTVYTDTLGQYTGLTDKNGTKIFEGDIVKIFYTDCFEIGTICCSNINSRFCFDSPDGFSYGFNVSDEFEVIGNIHDNPELLEGGAEK